MSFILDALNKSERDREAAVVGTQPPAALRRTLAVEPRRRLTGKAMGVIVGLCLIIAAVVGGWRYMAPSADSGRSSAVADDPASTSGGSEPTVEETAPGRSAIVSLPEVAATPPKTEAAAQAETEPEAIAEPAAEAGVGSDVPAPVLDLRASTLATQSIPAEQTLPRRLGQMPYAVQKAVAPLNLQVHVYDDDPDRCFVMINGATWAAGDEVKRGLRIKAIVPEGVVMSWKDDRFLLAPRD